jgi:hypothetical protein
LWVLVLEAGGGDATAAAWDLTKVSSETLDSSADYMFCAAARCASNVLDSSTADSS